MANQADTKALATDQFLQEAIMNGAAAHSFPEPATSVCGGPNPHINNLNGSTDGLSDLEPETSTTDLKTELLEAIDGINSSGSFAAIGGPRGIHVPDPSIFLKGVGPIKLPLDHVQAQKLKQRAQRASFGDGYETDVETNFGNICELEPKLFDITNPHWARLVEKATIWAAQQLGLSPGVSSRLHKMSLYEEGATMNPHIEYVSPLTRTRLMATHTTCSTAGTPDTFGTLLVCLPSAHEGGELVLRHQAHAKSFKSSEKQAFFACWYSDVTYEVLPVTSGYRWVLTYNLIHPPDTERPSANKLSHARMSLDRVLRRWSEGDESVKHDYMFYMLGDNFTDSTLSLNTLNRDALVKVRILDQVAASLEVEIFLALLEKTQITERAYQPDWHGYYDDEEDEEGEETQIVMSEEVTISMSDLVNLRGRQLISEYTFDNEDECVNRILQGKDAFDMADCEEEEQFTETGNDVYLILSTS